MTIKNDAARESPGCKFSDGTWNILPNRGEICPWPSRQQPIASDPCAKCTRIDHADSFAKGKAEGVRGCVDVVKKIFIPLNPGTRYQEGYGDAIDCAIKAIAALEGVKGE